MNNTRKQKVIAAIEQRMATKELSKNAMARQLDISPAQLLNVMDVKKHDKVSDDFWLKLYNKLGLGNTWDIIGTNNFNTIQEACAKAQQRKRMVGIAAESGYGKTIGLEFYAKNNPNAFYVFSSDAMNDNDFLRSIAKAIGIQSLSGNKYTKQELIAEALQGLSHPVLIFDDAGKLNDKCLSKLQWLYDATKGSVGIVIAGTPYLEEYIKKGYQKNKCGFAEFRRRIGAWTYLNAPSGATIKHFCERYGINDNSVIKLLQRRLKNYGDINEVIINIQDLSKGEPITLDIAERACSGLCA